MADYTNSKKGTGSLYPENAIDEGWQRLSPLITPQKLRTLHLFGIPLVSSIPDPLHGNQLQVMTDEILAEQINEAVTFAETDLGIDIMPIQRSERIPWDLQEYLNLGFMTTRHLPVSSIDSLTVNTANGDEIYKVDPSWIEAGYLFRGEIYIAPLNVSSAGSSKGAAGASLFLQIMGNRQWIPGFWTCTYTTGFPNGMLPVILNTYIGIVASINILSMLAATNAKSTSTSLGIDGLNQSKSGSGPGVYLERIADLEKKKKLIQGRLRASFGQTLFSDHV